jgi:Rieske Fe-S protein
MSLSPPTSEKENRDVDEPRASEQVEIWPIAVALGIAVLLVGLLVSPVVVAPLGAAIALVAAGFWVRSNQGAPRPEPTAPASSPRVVPGEERFPRSRLLEAATIGLGGLVALTVGLPAAAFAILPGFLGQRARNIDLGPVTDFPEGKFVVATFLTDPTAGEVSRRAAYVRNNGRLGPLPSFTVMSSRCTHVGCPTQPNGPLFMGQQRFVRTNVGEVSLLPSQPAGFGCPCHGSQFDDEGNRTAGPAPRALDRYEFSIRDGHLWLGRLYSVSRVDGAGSTAQIHAYNLHQAGQPVSGVESFLYPVTPAS